MQTRNIFIIAVVIASFHTMLCAKILGVFFAPSISHQAVYQPVWKELSLRGHQVTVLTPNPLKDETLTNLTEIDLGFVYQEMQDMKLLERMAQATGLFKFIVFSRVFGELFSSIIKNQLVQDLLQDNTASYDLLILEPFNPLVYGFPAKYPVPFVGIFSAGGMQPMHDAVGNPTHPVLYPGFVVGASMDSIWGRMTATYGVMLTRFVYRFVVLPEIDDLARQLFGGDIPYLGDIEKNVSLMFFNSNPVFYKPRPNVPAIVEIHQMHIKPKKPLPVVSTGFYFVSQGADS